jgi:hypothetical protein
MPSYFKKTLMVRIAIILLVVLSARSLAADVVITGYLVDVACSGRRARKPGPPAVHSKSCLQMPSCNDSGYGVLTEDKQFIRFDEGGNQKVRKLLAETDKDHDFKVSVSGSMDGDKMKISRIDLQ